MAVMFMNRPKHRGKWNRLQVKVIVLRKTKGGKWVKASKAQTARVLLDVLKGKPVPEGFKIKKIAWANPDANHFRSVDNPGESFLYDETNGLPTLNRGRWLEKMIGNPPPLPKSRSKKPGKGKTKNVRNKTRTHDAKTIQRPAGRKPRQRKA